MPNRILKESIVTSATIDSLSADQERFFYRLMVVCDDFGRFDGRAAVIRGRCYPLKLDVTTETVDGWLSVLESAGLLFRYEVASKPYLQIRNWDEHQNIRAKKSRFPNPAEIPSIGARLPALASNMFASASKCDHLPAIVPVSRISDLVTRVSDLDSRKTLVDAPAPTATGIVVTSSVPPAPSSSTTTAPPLAVLGAPGDDLGVGKGSAAPRPLDAPQPAPGLLALVPTDAARKPRKPTPKAPEEPTTTADRKAWLTRWGGHTGTPPAAVADLESPGFCIRYAIVRKARGADVLLRALDGTQQAKDVFWHGKSPLALLGDAAIDAGLAAALTGGRSIAAPGATPPPPKATVLAPLPNKTAESTAALNAHRPTFASREPKPPPPSQAEIEARIAAKRAQNAGGAA